MKTKKICALALLIAAILYGAAMAGEQAKPPKTYPPFIPTDRIMPISQVKPGMKGHCLTVIRGREVVSFPAEVVDVVPNAGAPKHLILIRVSGPVIEETGGIAAGMSGSPMYIGGKLVGAIGYGWNFSRHDLGLVTSIEDMIQVWNNPERIPSFGPAPIIPADPPVSGDEQPEPTEPKSPDVVTVKSYGDFIELRAPLYVGGVSPRVADMIGASLGAEVVPFGGGPVGDASKRAKYNAAMKPGDAIGTSLVWGDVEVSAIGTMSAVATDGRFLAFAHPFLNAGNTSAALTEATVSRVIPSLSAPFKLGRTGDMVGIVTQDRPEGIGGRIGQFAPAASCTIRFNDVDAGRNFVRRFQMVQDPFQIANLSSLAAAGCIEDLWGRRGAGSARVVTSFYGAALPQGWRRANVFVSETDVLTEMLKEFKLLTNMFALNQFQELRPFGMEVTVELTSEPRVVYIEDVKVPEGPFAPGQTVSFDITLRPWRKEPVKRTYSLVVPEKVTGICELMVRGGGIAEETAEYMEARWRTISSLPILLKELDAKEGNDQIVLEIRGQEALEDQIKRAQSGDPTDLMNEKLKSELRAEKEKEGSMRVIRTNYYVEGMIQKLIRVDPNLAKQ